jgi:O-antigen/teichoic acid export membrane protein
VRSIASNALGMAVVRGAPVGCRVLLLLAIARVALPEDLARISYAVAIAEGMRFLADGGMEVWGSRAIGRASTLEETSQAASTMAMVKLAFGVASAALALVLTYFTGAHSVTLAVLSAVFVIAGEAFNTAMIYHLARSTLTQLVPVALTFACLGIGSSLAALFIGHSPILACAVLAAGEIVMASVVITRLMTAKVLGSFPDIRKAARIAVGEAMPTAIYNSIAALYLRLDAVFLNATSVVAFATYTVAFRALQPFLFVFGAVSLSAYAAYVSKAADGQISLRRLLGSILGVALATAVVAYLSCAWLIVNLVPSFSEALPSLQILCALLPLLSVNSVSTYVLMSRRESRAVLGTAVMNLISTTLLLWLLVPSLGARGAAFALVGCQALNSTALLYLLARPRLKLAPA